MGRPDSEFNLDSEVCRYAVFSGNANRRIVRIASPWLAATVSVPGLVSPGCPENGVLSEIQL
jgi:hypothetical protein